MNLDSSTDLFRLLGDPNRARLLCLLSREELTVAELTRVTGMTQSRVSTHLGRLKKAGLVRDRRAGASSFHSLNEHGMPAEALSAWNLFQQATTDSLLEQDRQRIDEVVKSRNGDQSWVDSVAGQMERHYSPGRTWEATAWGMIGLARLGDVLDVASGDGVLAELLAPRARSVTCLDRSARVVAAGQRRLAHLDQVSMREGDMHDLPFPAEAFDEALLMNALTYSDDPEQAIHELYRVLRSPGRLVIVTLNRHRHATARERFDHVMAGFEPTELRSLLESAGFLVELCDVTSRERRAPYYEVVTVHASKDDDSARGRA